MLRLFTAVTLASALFAARADAQDPPKEPAKKDPKPAPAATGSVATDEEADAALAKFKKDVAAELASAQMAALKEVAKVRHEKVVRAIGPYLRSAHADVATS